jgi:hypothetical protein
MLSTPANAVLLANAANDAKKPAGTHVEGYQHFYKMHVMK